MMSGAPHGGTSSVSHPSVARCADVLPATVVVLEITAEGNAPYWRISMVTTVPLIGTIPAIAYEVAKAVFMGFTPGRGGRRSEATQGQEEQDDL